MSDFAQTSKDSSVYVGTYSYFAMHAPWSAEARLESNTYVCICTYDQEQQIKPYE
jgi:hypothetical protein